MIYHPCISQVKRGQRSVEICMIHAWGGVGESVIRSLDKMKVLTVTNTIYYLDYIILASSRRTLHIHLPKKIFLRVWIGYLDLFS